MDAELAGKGRKRRTRAITEQKILAAATEVFTKHGYANATIGEMVERSSLSRGAFYIYFTDKRDVFFALVSRATAELYAIEDSGPEATYRDRVRAATRAFLEGFARHSGVFRCLFEVSTSDAELGALHNKYRKEWVDRLRNHFHRHMGLRRFRKIDPEALALSVTGMIGGIAYEWLCARFDPWPDARVGQERLVDQVADLWCRCVFDDPRDADMPLPDSTRSPTPVTPSSSSPGPRATAADPVPAPQVALPGAKKAATRRRSAAEPDVTPRKAAAKTTLESTATASRRRKT